MRSEPSLLLLSGFLISSAVPSADDPRLALESVSGACLACLPIRALSRNHVYVQIKSERSVSSTAHYLNGIAAAFQCHGVLLAATEFPLTVVELEDNPFFTDAFIPDRVLQTSYSQSVGVTFLVASSSVQPVSAQAAAPAASPSASPDCDTIFTMRNGSQKTFTLCQNLVVQNATLAWTYYPGDNGSDGGAITGGILDLAYTNTLLSAAGWVGWGINPTQEAMEGSSVLVAFIDASAGSIVLPYKLTTALLAANPPTLVTGATDLDVLDSSVDIDATSLFTTIYATLQLQPGETNVYQVWNKGPSVTGRSPNRHNINSNTFLTSLAAIDVETGTVVAGASNTPAIQNIHGILNAISWGVLFPVGIMAARYMKPFAVFNPIWFYVHVGSQVCGYILGVAGFATGLKILDPADFNHEHRNLGIALFVFATLQVASLLLRPSPNHKLRQVWNLYHYAFGYAIVIMSIINIFQGFYLLAPPIGWKRAYIGVIVALGGLSVILEVVTWAVWLHRRIKQRKANAANGRSAAKLEQGSFDPSAPK
ncbi:unnamed protein product [Calypogeia fissa]